MLGQSKPYRPPLNEVSEISWLDTDEMMAFIMARTVSQFHVLNRYLKKF